MRDIEKQFGDIGLSKLEKQAIIQVKDNWDLRYLAEVMHEYACKFPSDEMIIHIKKTEIDDPITYIASFYKKK